MDELSIPDVHGTGGLLFFGRTPPDHELAISSFRVRLTQFPLTAEVEVFADLMPSLAHLFSAMATKWQGWTGELGWESLEKELLLCCTNSRFGHVLIRAELRPSLWPEAWFAAATIQTEAGQLEAFDRRAQKFFGSADHELSPEELSSYLSSAGKCRQA